MGHRLRRATQALSGLEGLSGTPVLSGLEGEALDSPGTPIVGGGVLSVLNFVDPAAVLQYVDVGFANTIQLTGSRVNQWDDLTANNFDYTQAVAANQPLFTASGGPNNSPFISLDDVARFMTSTLTTPLRTTTPTTMWFVARQVSWANGRRLLSDTTNLKKLILQDTATPEIDLFDGGNVGNNAGGTLGSFARWIADWAMAPASCRLKIGATNVAGLNPGASAADVGRLIGNNVGSSAISDWLVLVYMNRALTAQEENDLDTIFIPGRFGAGVLV